MTHPSGSVVFLAPGDRLPDPLCPPVGFLFWSRPNRAGR